MFGDFIVDILDHILPCSDRSKHDITRLEYLSACKVMENENYVKRIIPLIPASMFDLLLQSAIYKCYLEFISMDYLNPGTLNFPESLGILILNWPHTEFILRNEIPSLHPPVELLHRRDGPLAAKKLIILDVEYMILYFDRFCTKLIQLIANAVFKCTSINTRGYACVLRRLDVSGFGSQRLNIMSSKDTSGGGAGSNFSRPEDILEGIQNSSIDTFGHKIDIIADAKFDFHRKETAEFIKEIIEERLNPNVGISVYFNKVTAQYPYTLCPIPSYFYNVLALGRCEYVEFRGFDIDISFAENLHTHLPGLVSLSLPDAEYYKSFDFLRGFKSIEQLNVDNINLHYNGLVNSICNMSKGLKCLDLIDCDLRSKDLKCLANSIHSDTLLELKLRFIIIKKDSDAVGFITLCQKLNNIKVLKADDCSLEILSSKSVSKLVSAFKMCTKLEFLSMKSNEFSVETTNVILNGLAHNKSLRYLCIDLPERDNEDREHRLHLCEGFHETINKFRCSPIYISWLYFENGLIL